MGHFYDEIPERVMAFIERAHIFFVATAPLQGGSVNVSPKASHTGDGKTRLFEIIDKNRVRYLDLTGSGNETVSHLLQKGNGRLTIMFVNIEAGAPNIVRLYGKASVHERGGVEPGQFASMWHGKDGQGKDIPIGGRAIIDLNIHTCATSCGYSIPVFEYVKPRTVLDDFFKSAEKRGIEAVAKSKGKLAPTGSLLPPLGPDGLLSIDEGKKETVKPRPMDSVVQGYWAIINNTSIDGLPGLSCVRGMRNQEEQAELMAKCQEHDNLEPPPPTLPAWYHEQKRNIKGHDANSVAIAKSGSGNALVYTFFHLLVAFSCGCACTAAFLIAAQSRGWQLSTLVVKS